MQPQSPILAQLQRRLNQLNKRFEIFERNYKQTGFAYHTKGIAAREALFKSWGPVISGAWTIVQGEHESIIPEALQDIRDLAMMAKGVKIAIDVKEAERAKNLLEEADERWPVILYRMSLLNVSDCDIFDDEIPEEQASGEDDGDLEQGIEDEPEDDGVEVIRERFLPDADIEGFAETVDGPPADDEIIVEETTTDYRYRLAKIAKMPLERRREFGAWIVELAECRHALRHGIIKEDAEGNVPIDELAKYAFGRWQHLRVPIYCRYDLELMYEHELKLEEEARADFLERVEDGQVEARRIFGEGAAIQFL